MNKFNTILAGISLLLIIGGFSSCKKESTPSATANEHIDLAVAAPQSDNGNFKNGPYGAVTGNARVYNVNGKLQLALSQFNTSNGPDLKVYISQEQSPVHFVNLGSLKSTNGDQLYNIPDGADAKTYPYVLIYCQQYSHLFGFAQLIY